MAAIHPLLQPFAATLANSPGWSAEARAHHNAALAEPRSGPERRTVRLLRVVAEMASLGLGAATERMVGPILQGASVYVQEADIGDLDAGTLDAALRGLAASAGIALEA